MISNKSNTIPARVFNFRSPKNRVALRATLEGAETEAARLHIAMTERLDAMVVGTMETLTQEGWEGVHGRVDLAYTPKDWSKFGVRPGVNFKATDMYVHMATLAAERRATAWASTQRLVTWASSPGKELAGVIFLGGSPLGVERILMLFLPESGLIIARAPVSDTHPMHGLMEAVNEAIDPQFAPLNAVCDAVYSAFQRCQSAGPWSVTTGHWATLLGEKEVS